VGRDAFLPALPAAEFGQKPVHAAGREAPSPQVEEQGLAVPRRAGALFAEVA
jgi:hypothetical protein